MRACLKVAGCVAGLVMVAGPAFAQGIPNPNINSPAPPQGNVAPVPTPQPAIPTPLLPPPIVGPVPVQSPTVAPTPAPSNLPVPLNVPHPEIGNGTGKVPTVPGVNIPQPPPDNNAADCTASWYDLPGKAICSMVNEAHQDTADSLKHMRVVLQIPDITSNPEFQMIYSYVWPVVDAMILLLFVYGCIRVIGNEWTGFTWQDLIVRTGVAIAGASFLIPILGWAIRGSNAIVRLILTVSPSALQPSGDGTTQGIAFAVLGVILMLLAIAMLILNLINWSVLGVGAGFGGICNALAVTDQTEEAARHWWRMVFWLTLSPVIQAFALVFLTQVFLNSSPTSGNGLLFDTAQRVGTFAFMVAIPVVCLAKASSGHKATKAVKWAYLLRKVATGGIA